ncbi:MULTISPECIES: sugar phosphate isomerase/epimerase family protein [Streptomyces]|uniref:Sugar phosphate isomerase/epimerase family protein n=1 Tax=Streptomyces evansiae TaxID=3075535 RepID=A0ABU2QV16_9ACTN|nr:MULTISPECIES: sugar phosphate isomerase/epimerase family protein [unclassified Streptomyces]MDT0408302.1 sugar phosphate isomerase/epimerase family protein [Streptomyces sp. DSM 41979]MYQ57738.1 TIM barrel protein [Streptomyces sp. SID4926]SCE33276.1 Sugar phosphate isomerase/epimerase [Streptomyces sp. DfronAA-171]
MLKIACQEQLLPGGSLQEKWDFAQEAGYDAVELRSQGEFRFRDRLPELPCARADGGVMPTVCVEMPHFFAAFDDDLCHDALEQMKSQLSVAAEIGALGVRTPASYGMFSRRLPPFEPPRSEEEDREVLLSGLTELGEHARAEGVTLFLEPLNRYEDHMVNRLDQAAGLIAAVGLDSVRIGIDSYHMNIEESDPAAAILAAAPFIGHAQVSDSNRFQPGAGHLDWSAWLGALHTIGFDGYLAAECRLTGDPVEAVRSLFAFLRRSGA